MQAKRLKLVVQCKPSGPRLSLVCEGNENFNMMNTLKPAIFYRPALFTENIYYISDQSNPSK